MPGTILISETVAERRLEAIAQAAPDRPIAVLGTSGSDLDPKTIEVAFLSADLYPDKTQDFFVQLLDATNLRWLHSFSAGVDHPIFATFTERGAMLTTSSGAGAATVAQTAILFVLALSRGLPRWSAAQARKEWAPHNVAEIVDANLVVVGLGPIGTEIAKLGQALGMKVRGLRRTPRGDEPCETWPMEKLTEALGDADYVVAALPHTDATDRIFNAAAFAAMPKRACFVNVGRGRLVDEEAMISALQTGTIAGAGLDVFVEEPLPDTSPLWTLPNVMITPHSAGQSSLQAAMAEEVFLDNLKRFEAGDPLKNRTGD